MNDESTIKDIIAANTLTERDVEPLPEGFGLKEAKEILTEMYKAPLRPASPVIWLSSEQYELYKKAGWIK